MKKVICCFFSIMVLISSTLGFSTNALADSINTASQIEIGKTYSQVFTYYEHDGEEYGVYDKYYWFESSIDGRLEVTMETSASDLSNVYLELFDEDNAGIADGIFNKKKNAFYLSYDNLKKGKIYYLCIDCFCEATTTITANYHKHTMKLTRTYAAECNNGQFYDGFKYYECDCSEYKEVVIPRVKSINQSQSVYVYNGKPKKPAISIKDRTGKALKNNTDYSVSYSKGRKNVGTYKIRTVFKGNYKGSVTKTFKIIPKGTTISKVVKKSTSFIIKWKKQAIQTSGYEIQYSNNKNFKHGNVTFRINSNKVTKKNITFYKSKKIHYIRIRTYKTVNGKRYYSKWSKVKTIKTN